MISMLSPGTFILCLKCDDSVCDPALPENESIFHRAESEEDIVLQNIHRQLSMNVGQEY